ncbi:hypothetical protein ACWDV4_07640 [Micromonospora sp. NPDC003197]
MMRDGYMARWQGREYEASPDGDQVRIYQPEPGNGFAEIRPGRFVRLVPATEVDDLAYVRTICSWQGQPFIVLGAHESWLRVEYTGGRWPIAQSMGLEEFDFGVYQGWAPAHEVTEVREQRV